MALVETPWDTVGISKVTSIFSAKKSTNLEDVEENPNFEVLLISGLYPELRGVSLLHVHMTPFELGNQKERTVPSISTEQKNEKEIGSTTELRTSMRGL